MNKGINSYFSHQDPGYFDSNIGYIAFIKAKRDYEREFYLKHRAGQQRGVKTATVRPGTFDSSFGSYQASTVGNFRQQQNNTMNAIARSQNMSHAYARRRIIVAHDKHLTD